MIRSMKAIIVKELRENLPWAGLMLIVTAGLLALGIYKDLRGGIPFLEESSQLIYLLMYPLAGLLLGLAQIFQDYRKGRWQFVTHRPVSRTQLFFGKVVAGLLLYVLATGMPLIIAAIWVATPGHVAYPFTIDAMQPVLAMLISGMVWYGVGLLIATRSVRWFGSRIMPASIAIVGMFAAKLFAMTFLQAVGIAVLCETVLLAGACGAFVAGGETSRIPRWAKPSIGLAVALGWMMTVLVGTGITVEAIQTLTTGSNAYSPPTYQLNAEGNLVEDEGGKGARGGSSRLVETSIQLDHDDDRGRVSRVQSEGFLAKGAHMRVIDGAWGGGSTENWSYLVKQRIFEGYNFQTFQHVGSIGRDGFVAVGKTARPFPETVKTPYGNGAAFLFISQNSVFAFDLSARQIERIYTGSKNEVVLSATKMADITERVEFTADHNFYAVVTRDKIHIVRGSDLVVTVPIAPEIARFYYCILARTPTGNIVEAVGINSSWEDVHALVYSPAGELIRRTDNPAPPDPIVPPQPNWERYGLYVTTPPAFFFTISTLRAAYYNFIPWKQLALPTAAAILYATIAWCILRKRHIGRAATCPWLVLVTATGLAGILIVLSLIDSVASTPCTKCGKRRLATEGRCIHCKTLAAPPSMEGIEIFEPSLR